jgi:hypothetical protein
VRITIAIFTAAWLAGCAPKPDPPKTPIGMILDTRGGSVEYALQVMDGARVVCYADYTGRIEVIDMEACLTILRRDRPDLEVKLFLEGNRVFPKTAR